MPAVVRIPVRIHLAHAMQSPVLRHACHRYRDERCLFFRRTSSRFLGSVQSDQPHDCLRRHDPRDHPAERVMDVALVEVWSIAVVDAAQE